MNKPKFPHIRVQLTGRDGNAGTVLGAVTLAMRRSGVPDAEIDAFRVKAISGSYDDLLRLAMETVNVS